MFGLYKVMTTKGEIHFIGRYRRDLETNNWHYYEKENGEICHFRKEHMVAVFGDDAETIKKPKKLNNATIIKNNRQSSICED